MESDDTQLPEWLRQIRDAKPGERIETPEKLSTTSRPALLHSKTIIEEKVDGCFSAVSRIFTVSVEFARVGMTIGLIVGAIIWFTGFTKSKVIIEVAMWGGVPAGLLGGVFGVVFGIGREICRFCKRNDQSTGIGNHLNSLNIPKREVGVRKATIKTGFWLGFRMLEGAIIGFVGGLIFGLIGFWEITSIDEWIFVGKFALMWSGFGLLMGIIFGIVFWFSHNIIKQAGHESMGRPLDWELGKRVFSKIFGSYDRY